MNMEKTECSETSAYKIQKTRNYPEENIQHTEQGESLKSRICMLPPPLGLHSRRRHHHSPPPLTTHLVWVVFNTHDVSGVESMTETTCVLNTAPKKLNNSNARELPRRKHSSYVLLFDKKRIHVCNCLPSYNIACIEKKIVSILVVSAKFARSRNQLWRNCGHRLRSAHCYVLPADTGCDIAYLKCELFLFVMTVLGIKRPLNF